MNTALATMQNKGMTPGTRLISSVGPMTVAADTTGAIVTTYNTAPTISALADIIGSDTTPPVPLATDLSVGRWTIDRGEGTLMAFRFFGVGSDGHTGSAYIIGWDYLGSDATGYRNMVQLSPVYLCAADFTLGAKTGIASGIITASHLYADTISVTRQGSLPPNQVRVIGLAAGGDNGICDLVVDILECRHISVILNKGASATSVGFAYRMLSGS